jgi:AraC-like DNA-binding protein
MKKYKEHVIHGDYRFTFDLFDQTWKENHQACRLHWHEESEWIYVYEGKISVYIDAVEHIVEENQLICIAPYKLHYIQTLSKCHYTACVFKPEMLNFFKNDYIENNYLRPYIEQKLTLPKPISFTSNTVKHFFQSMIPPFNQKEEGYQLKIKAALLNIFAILIEEELFVVSEKQTKHQLESIETVLTYIEEHYQEKLSNRTLATLINYNTQYFTRYFKLHTGETPIEYLNHYRLEKAAEALVESETSILDISLNCGFNSYSYFIKKFKAYKKVSPYDYRKKLKIPTK